MHPNVFLKTFWRLELKPQVFVAMSFAPEYLVRYERVIAPAISSIALEACRVDISKSGDSILTDIMDGVSHSRLILADISSIGKDSKTGEAYRNGNVMYEVGLALACRQPSDVLLVRDDKDRSLFDVSTVPQMHLDFTDTHEAQAALSKELQARLREQDYVNDARVKIAVASLSNQEIRLLSEFFADMAPGQVRGWKFDGTVLSVYEAAIMRLLDKRVLSVAGKFKSGFPAYHLTELGRIVARIAKSGLTEFSEPPPKAPGA